MLVHCICGYQVINEGQCPVFDYLNCKRKENNVNLTLRTLETHFEVYLKEQRRSDMEKRAVITVVGRICR